MLCLSPCEVSCYHLSDPNPCPLQRMIFAPRNQRKSIMKIQRKNCCCCCCSVNKLSDSLQPIELQHTRLPCPSPSPRVCSNSCPLSQWCHPNISSSGAPFSSCLQFFPASRSFPMSQLFTSGDQNIGEGNGKPLQYSCLLRTPWMNILKKTKQKLIQSWLPWI